MRKFSMNALLDICVGLSNLKQRKKCCPRSVPEGNNGILGIFFLLDTVMHKRIQSWIYT